jgi:hypothetical protein
VFQFLRDKLVPFWEALAPSSRSSEQEKTAVIVRVSSESCWHERLYLCVCVCVCLCVCVCVCVCVCSRRKEFAHAAQVTDWTGSLD